MPAVFRPPPPTCLRALACLAAAVLIGPGCGASGVSPRSEEPATVVRPPDAGEARPREIVEQGTARARVIYGDVAPLSGAAAHGRTGDLRLENEAVRAVVLSQEHRGFVSASGGVLVDVSTAGGQDGLGELVPIFDDRGVVTARLDLVDVAQDGRAGGPAIVRAHGHHATDEELRIDVDYIVEPGAERVRIVLMLENRGRNHYRELPIGFLVRWGALTPFVPGGGSSLIGTRTRSAWVGGDAGVNAVALTHASGALMQGVHGRDWSVVILERAYVRPGAMHIVEAHLYAADAGGVAAAVRRLHAARGTVVGQVSGTVVESGAAPHPVAGAWITLVDAMGQVVQRARADGEGAYRLTVPPGRYRAIASAAGRAPSRPVALRVSAEKEKPLTLRVGRPSALAVHISDADGTDLAGRIRLTGLDGTPDPVLGAPGSPRDGNEVLVPTGRVSLEVPPGRYRLVASAGPGRALWDTQIELSPGRTEAVAARLPAEVDAREWYALDTRVHTRFSPGSSASLDTRVAACLAEGVDGVVVADDGHRTIPGAEKRGAPGATRRLTVFPGLSVTSADGERFGAVGLGEMRRLPDDLGRRANEVLTALGGLEGPPLVAAYEARAPETGYFERFAFDARAEALPRGGFSLDFGLLEIASGPETRRLDTVRADWVGLLARGKHVVPVGASASRGVAAEPCGRPRTLVRLGSAPPPADAAALRGRLAGGDVVVTYGPIVDLEVDGTRPGGTAGERGTHTVKVRMQAPSWLRPEVLELHGADGVLRTLKITRPKGRQARALDYSRTITLATDSPFLFAVLDGPPRALPDGSGRVRPYAQTNAVFFEAPAAALSP